MAIKIASSLSASGICSGLLVFASSTLWPFCSMGVMTMKMISRTSITSTIGVTLISELTFLPSSRFTKAMFASLFGTPTASGNIEENPRLLTTPICQCRDAACRVSTRSSGRRLTLHLPSSGALQEVIDQLRGRVIHLHVEGFNLVGEVVEHHHGGDGDEQSDGRRHQRFRNTTGDCTETGRLLRRDLAERVQNSDHGAEQSDEWSGGTDGRETAESALQFGVNDGFGTLESALAGFNLLARNVGGFAVRLEFLQTSSNDLRQMRLLVA